MIEAFRVERENLTRLSFMRSFSLLSPVLALSLALTGFSSAHPTTPSTSGAAAAPVDIAPVSETPEQWIALAKRVHGGFGSYLPLGIRIGLDARQRLNAGPRELDVTYFDGPNAPCPCVLDGLMVATGATLGQGSLRLAPHKSGPGTFGVALIRQKTTGKTLRYTIPSAVRSRLDWLNANTDERGRFDGVMTLPESQAFTVQTLAVSASPKKANMAGMHGAVKTK